MKKILQNTIPYDALSTSRLPGIAPLDPDDWLIVDEAYAGQMARRETLLSDSRTMVLALDPEILEAAQELLDVVLGRLLTRPQGDFLQEGTCVTCPDGRTVAIDREDPLGTLGRLVQEDFCLLDKRGGEHVLLGAVLCFPASWMLSEKFRRPLIDIHVPVDSYGPDLAKRVQRLFDAVRPDRPLWRYNVHWYHDPELYQPRSASAPKRQGSNEQDGPYLRSEKQCILRLPESGVAVFSIHTFVVARADLAV